MDKVDSKYQIEECVSWITSNGYQKVVIQFSEEELPDSVTVVKKLKGSLPSVEFYTVLTASCCVDYLAPLRLGEDFIHAIICFGSGASNSNLCLSSSETAFDQVPVLYVFGSNQELTMSITAFPNDIVLYDLKCMSFLTDFIQRSRINPDQVGKVIKTNNKWSFTRSISQFIVNQAEASNIFGRFSLAQPITEYDRVIWIGNCEDLYYRVNIPISEVIMISPFLEEGSIMKPRSNLTKRLALIEKAKTASTIGIVFSNSIPNVELILDRVKKLSVRKGKKLFFLSLVQEADNTKFGNFPLIDVFVIVSSCTCGSLARSIKAHAPLITLTEYEISLGVKASYGGVEWNTEIVDEDTVPIEVGKNHQVMEYKEWMGNSWYGLQVAPGCDPVTKIEEGSKGIASGYEHETK